MNNALFLVDFKISKILLNNYRHDSDVYIKLSFAFHRVLRGIPNTPKLDE